MPPTSRLQPTYAIGEKTLCFHGPVLYEAKVVESRQTDESDRKSAWEYFVHYQGWKKSWDEWVADERIRKDTPENRDLMKVQQQSQKNVQKQAEQAKRDSKKASTDAKKASLSDNKRASKGDVGRGRKSRGGEDTSSVRGPSEDVESIKAAAPASRGTKRKVDAELEKEEDYIRKPAVRIPLPDLLKSMLVDDWEWITKDQKLVPIPHPHPVSEILADYRAAELPRRRPGSADADTLDEIIQGMREYFDKSLGRLLLYRIERQQYLEINTAVGKDPSDPSATLTVTLPANDDGKPEEEYTANVAGKTPSELYGAEHLCRLFVMMPELIAQTNMDGQSMRKLGEELGKLTQWLTKHWGRYEAKAYFDPGRDYVERAKGLHQS